MQKCIVSANCQGEALIKQILFFAPFRRDFEVEYYVNFKNEEVPLEELANCGLLIYQKLDSSWGNLSEDFLLSHVNPKAKVISLPNVVNFALYPTAKYVGTLEGLWDDTFVEPLLARGLSLQEILYLVSRADFSEKFDLDSLYKNNLSRERAKGYTRCDELCDFIDENFTKKVLFTTPNHPSKELLAYIAKMVLEEIGYKGVPDILNPKASCDEEYYLPINPTVAKYFGIPNIDDKTLYPVFANKLTYQEYIAGYVLAKQQKIPLARFYLSCTK